MISRLILQKTFQRCINKPIPRYLQISSACLGRSTLASQPISLNWIEQCLIWYWAATSSSARCYTCLNLNAFAAFKSAITSSIPASRESNKVLSLQFSAFFGPKIWRFDIPKCVQSKTASCGCLLPSTALMPDL